MHKSVRTPLFRGRRLGWAAGLAVVALGVPLLGSTGSPAAAGQEPRTIRLERSTQPRISRPVLDGLERAAKNDGVPLATELDRHVAKVVAGTPKAQAVKNDASLPDIEIDDLSLAELEDLKLIARSEAITFDEAIDRYGWQAAFQKVSDKIRSAYPHDVAGVTMTDDGHGARFGFKGKVPAAAIALAKTLPATVELVGGKGYSEEDLEKAQKSAYRQVADRAGAASVESDYDADTGVITVDVLPGRTLNAAEKQKELARIRSARLADARFKVQVNVLDGSKFAPLDKKVRGGGLMNSANGKQALCTMGFTVKAIRSSTKGISTAGHCAAGNAAATRTYKNHSRAGGSTKIKRKSFRQGALSDLGWYTGGSFAVTQTFYYATNKTRTATGRSGMPGKGTKICHYGRTTGSSCGKVTKANVTLTYTNGITYHHMIVLRGAKCDNGDSGGPWYSGGMAYGIMSGGNGVDCVIAPAYLLQNQGVDVWHK
jgi:hypothetical protein